MGVSIYKRMNKTGKESIYLRIAYKGIAKHEFTGLYSGKGKHKNLESEQLAKELAKKRLIQLVSNTYQVEDRTDLYKLNDFIESIKKTKLKLTQSKYNQLQELLKNLSHLSSKLLKQISQSELQMFINRLEDKGYANQTIYKHVGMLKSIFKLAHEDAFIIHNPMRKIKYKEIRPIKDFLNRDELKRIQSLDLNQLNNGIKNTANRSASKLELSRDLFLFACYTGLRISDVMTLDLANDLKENRIIKYQFKVKDEIISIPLMDDALEILNKYISGSKFHRFPYVSNQKLNKSLIKIAGLVNIDKHVTFHTARYTFITLLLDASVDIYTVQKLAGHKTIKTTEHYAKLVDGRAELAIDRYCEYLNG